MTSNTRTYIKNGKSYTYTTTPHSKWEAQVNKSGVQPETYMEFYQDPKDTEVYAAPKTHHVIKCRYCDKQSRESLKYTRSCADCRENKRVFRHLPTEWSTWGDTAF